MYNVSGDTFAVVDLSENSMFIYSKFIAGKRFQFTVKASQVTVCSVLIIDVLVLRFLFLFFHVSFFFHEQSQFTGHQEKGDAISLNHLYHFHPLYRHLDISQVITADSSPLHIASSHARTGNLCFQNASC